MDLATIILLSSMLAGLIGHIAFVSWKFGTYSQKQNEIAKLVYRLDGEERMRLVNCATHTEQTKHSIENIIKLEGQLTDLVHKYGILNDSMTKLSMKVERLDA